MEGNQSDLIALTALKKQHDYSLVVDDSHGIGVLGDAGAGTTAHFGIKADIITASLGKALASHGGFVAGPEDLIEALIQSARPLIYSTAIPPSSAAAALAALTLMEKKSQHQAKCHENIAYFREQSKEKGLNALKSQTAIQGIIISDIKQLKTVHQHLLESGFLVGMIRPPSVPKNSSRLRICLSAAHTKKHIDALIQHTLIALEKST